MSELNYAEQAVLNGDPFDPDELFGGWWESKGLYLPRRSEQAQQSCTGSWLNLLEALARRMSCASTIYIYRDDADGEDEFSVHAGPIAHQGRWLDYAGEINLGPLSRGVDNYVWLDLSGAAAEAGVGTAWAEGPHIVRLGVIAMPAEGYWLDGDMTRLTGGQGVVAGLSSPGVLAATLHYNSSSPLVIGRVAAGCSIGTCRVIVRTAWSGFDEPYPSLSIGDAESDDRFLARGLVDLAEPDTICEAPSQIVRYDEETELLATHVGGGATAGEAAIYLEALP